MQTVTRLTCLVVVLMSLVTPLAHAQGGEPAAVAVLESGEPKEAWLSLSPR